MPDPHATTDRVPRKRMLTQRVPIPPTQHMGRSTIRRDDRARWHILDLDSRALCGRQSNIGAIATFSDVVTLRGLVCNECHRKFSWQPKPHEYEVQDTGYTTPCKVWTRGLDSFGYPRRGKPEVRPHREMYEQTHGPIPEGYVLHHLCGVKTCIEPSHVTPITRAEHALIHNEERGRAPGGEFL